MTDRLVELRGAWIGRDDQHLPEPVRQLRDPCRGLWCAGDATLLARGIRVGIIGSRRPREDSCAHARRITRDAARIGFTVVSGLALGIDGIAHAAAVDGGGGTIAVLPGGLDQVYPRRHGPLARRIVDAGGAVVSEYAAGAGVRRHHFQQRNRLIAALSDYLMVVQAAHGSGSMGTASAALDLGVPIGIVLSAPDDPLHQGSIGLVRDGADVVMDGVSLCRRLELHGVVEPGFAEAVGSGARCDPEQSRRWIGGGAGQVRLALLDHPLGSLLEVPRPLEDVAELAGLSMQDTRRMLTELEDGGDAVLTPDGCWLAAAASV